MVPEYTRPGALEPLFDRRVYIETYGCRYNFGDTAKLTEVLRHHGATIVDSEDEADVVVVNTCTVVGSTERRMLRRLSQLRDREVFVTGCMPAVQPVAIRSVCSPVFLSPDAIQEYYGKINTVGGGEAGIVQVARGCIGQCTYCITRFARGPLRSFPAPAIRSQVMAFAAKGTAEIQLTAQDVSAWGRDISSSLPSLLRAISDVPPSSMIRVGMMNPATVRDILDDLIDALSAPRIFRFLHLPVQSGSDNILSRMGREYTVSEYETIIAAFRKRLPDISLMTDVIVGFPGESDEDFSETLKLVDRVRPNKVNVTRYSRRPLTPLADAYDFPDAVKKDRSRLLQAHAESLYSAINAPQVSTVAPFVVTETIRPGSVMARTPNYTGIVLNEDLPQGFTGNARLVRDRRYFFIGERIR
jgi:MiaB-like tRNA modifying enzyme